MPETVSQTAAAGASAPAAHSISRSDRRQRRRNVRRWLVVLKVTLDSIGFALAWGTAWAIRVALEGSIARPLNPDWVYLASLPIIVLGSLLTGAALDNYGLRQTRGPLEGTAKIFKTAFASLLVVMSLGFLVKEFDFSRTIVVLFGVLMLVYLPVVRKVSGVIQERLVKLGILGTRVLIVGAGQMGIRALQKVHDHPEIGYRMVGFLDDDREKASTGIGRTPVLGTLDDLRQVVTEEAIDEVIIAIPNLEPERQMALVMAIDDLPVRVKVVANLFGVLAHETTIDLIEDIPVYDLEGAEDSAFYRISKRLFDLGVASVVMLGFLVLLPFLALAIKLDSKGPVFFVHDRVGQHGKTFRMWKFRTMRTDVGAYEVAPKADGDPRITKLGAFLRATSLDELPQVINVLKGDMSVVGPRPEMPFIVAEYNEWQRKRLEVKPGITGLWQILGRKDLPLHENLEYDFYYIKNRSLFLDLIIVAKTVPATLLRKGAY